MALLEKMNGAMAMADMATKVLQVARMVLQPVPRDRAQRFAIWKQMKDGVIKHMDNPYSLNVLAYLDRLAARQSEEGPVLPAEMLVFGKAFLIGRQFPGSLDPETVVRREGILPSIAIKRSYFQVYDGLPVSPPFEVRIDDLDQTDQAILLYRDGSVIFFNSELPMARFADGHASSPGQFLGQLEHGSLRTRLGDTSKP